MRVDLLPEIWLMLRFPSLITILGGAVREWASGEQRRSPPQHLGFCRYPAARAATATSHLPG